MSLIEKIRAKAKDNMKRIALPEGDDLLVLNIPPVKPDCLVPVIEMYLK